MLQKKTKVIAIVLMLAMFLSAAGLNYLPANAADEGEPGAKPIGFTGAYLTTINNETNTSTTGESVVDSNNVPLSPTIKLVFDKNVVNDAIWSNNQQCVTLQTGSGSNVPINVFRISDLVNFSERNHFFISPLNNLTPGTAYKIIVSSSFKAKTGVELGYNLEVNFTTAGEAADTSAPTWPAGSSLTASGVTQTGLTLNWTAATDNKAVTGYRVYRNGSLLGIATSTSYNVTGLTAGTSYTFKVEAGDAAGNWSSSGPSANVTTSEAADTSAPTWPAGSSLTASGVTQNSLTLNWTAATDNKAVTGYRVYRNGSLLTTVTGTSYNVTDLAAGTSYTFKVEAGDAAGNWSSSGPSANVTTSEAADTSAPTWPAGSSLTASGVTQNSLTLNWTAATDNKAVTGYRVYRNGSLIGSVTGTSYNVTGLAAGTSYTFKVEAGDAAGNWSSSGPSANVTTSEAADTSAPTWPAGSSLTASGVTQNSLTLNWTAATDNKAVTGYRVYRNGSLLTTVTGTSYNVTGLTAGTSYTFKVEAGDAAGNWSSSGPSATVTTSEAADTSAPTWPAGSSLTASGVTQNSLNLNWTAANDNKAVTGYRVYRNGSLLGTAASTSYNVTGLTAGTSYTFKVEAGDAAGNWSSSGPSVSVSTSGGGGTVGDTIAPSWPLGSNLKASYIYQTGVILSWNKASDNVAVKSYRIYRDGVLVGSTSGTWFSAAGLTAGTSYTFKVEAGDAAGNWSTSGPSTSVTTYGGGGTVGDKTAPAWPSGSSLTASGVTQNSLTLNWTAATDNKAVTGYRVYRNGSLIGSVTGTSYNVTGLTAGASYTFKVEAGDAAGNWSSSGPSASVTTSGEGGTVGDKTAPAWPYGSYLRASYATQTGVLLSWNKASDNVAVKGYRLYQNGSLIGSVTGTSYNVTGLTAGTSYAFKVEAGDAAGNWSSSGPSANVKTVSSQTSQPPVVVNTDPANGSYNITLSKTIVVTFNTSIKPGPYFNMIKMTDQYGRVIAISKSAAGPALCVKPLYGLKAGTKYKVSIPTYSIMDISNRYFTGNHVFSFSTVQL
ncbi:fibronectin type III domain-containing protein [Pelotomaculum propionicicum]|uniref:fibronectin type III domain-containing protein n=1 Tax=Pelotomaculum propionicicum TaxID=258475 RepID=UPI003B75E854